MKRPAWFAALWAEHCVRPPSWCAGLALASLAGLASAQSAPAPGTAAQAAGSTLSPAALPQVQLQTLAIRLPAETLLRFRGQSADEKSQGAAGGMVYPGGAGLAGLIAGVLTHAVMNDSIRSSQRKAEEEAADAMLRPYRPVLDQLLCAEVLAQAAELAQLAQKARIVPAQEVVDTDWTLKIAPVFYMTPDQRAVLLDADMAVEKGIGSDPVWRKRVRLMSPVTPAATTPQSPWLDEDGRRLRHAARHLLSRAYRIAMEGATQAPVATGEAAPERTVRFWEGNTKRFERGAVLKRDDCGWALVRNLRDELLSVSLVEGASMPPLSAPGEDCVLQEAGKAVAPQPAASSVPAASSSAVATAAAT